MAHARWFSAMIQCGLAISPAAAQLTGTTASPTSNPHAGEIYALPVRGWPQLSFDLALEAARKAVAVCAAHKTGIVVEVFGADGRLRVMLASDGPVNAGAEAEAQENAANVQHSNMPSGGALPLRRGDVQRGVISVAGAWDNDTDDESPALNAACATAGLGAIQSRL
jgi:hypothetical protein